MNSNNNSASPGQPLPPAPLTNADQRSRTLGEADAETLQGLLQRANISTWDVLIVGDGSGSGWDGACGWSSVLIDRESRGRRLFWGAMNVGSVNFGETMPYLHALNWYDANGGKERLKQQGFVRVHVITDSQVVAHWGSQAAGHGVLPRKHIILWAGMREFRRLGYQVTFHWMNRAQSLLNVAADLVASLARRAVLDAITRESGAPPYEDTLATRAASALDAVRFEDPRSQTPIDLYHLNHDAE